MSTSNIQNNATTIMTPSPLLLSEFSRCRDNPDLAVNNYFNYEKDPNKSDKVIDILNHSYLELFESKFNYSSIVAFCLYKLIFFSDVKIFYFCKNKDKTELFRQLLSSVYIESKLKLKPLLLVSTDEKFMLYNQSQIKFCNNVNHFNGQIFSYIIIDDCTQELYKEIWPEIKIHLDVFKKLGCDQKIIRVNRL